MELRLIREQVAERELKLAGAASFDFVPYSRRLSSSFSLAWFVSALSSAAIVPCSDAMSA
ncbi:MAG: hypothetical protein IPF92_25465 [Myxococcales bacterium]|nr:hypothetical protein [Myxococcales bacterium]